MATTVKLTLSGDVTGEVTVWTLTESPSLSEFENLTSVLQTHLTEEQLLLLRNVAEEISPELLSSLIALIKNTITNSSIYRTLMRVLDAFGVV